VATHLSRDLHAAGHTIDCIWSRSQAHADRLASEFGSVGISDPELLPSNTDFCLVAVPDGVIYELTGKFKDQGGIWMHTAGAVSMDVLAGSFSRCGVLYPLQTLSSGRNVQLHDTPFLVEGSNQEVTRSIHTLASCISRTVIEMDSSQRLVVHLAAVFANNFSNHMVTIAKEILKQQKMDPSLLDPLLRETFSKMMEMGPENAQTGPAARMDHETIQKHLEWIKSHPEWEKLYTFISRDIMRSRQSEH
jgi:predicted short-subunit dehydrogenase-like oxidoreductase (DUF2520 family)